ncbi:MAG: 30S ribosomal protein S9 [Bacteroidetes bacterium GWE2_29_8]|nr:MAG: 30S ribosomal protein S9 [Bacteroidetes bacterium GWE2_29_8]OFY22400.1 MAG: 30S ribosomal protein S9 [Bacteroidetes bacterium GWF2_29_10]
MDIINAIGRRKTAVARVYIKEGTGSVTVNHKDYKVYFPTEVLQYVVNQAMTLTNNVNNFDIKANIAGGGFKGQAEALRLGISRALCKIDLENRPILKQNGLLTRDPRMVERKKPGQKKARKKFQFSKR